MAYPTKQLRQFGRSVCRPDGDGNDLGGVRMPGVVDSEAAARQLVADLPALLKRGAAEWDYSR